MINFNVPKNREKLFDIIKQILGVLALILGIAGIIFPILPGWIFIFIGLELLGIKIVFFDRIKEYALKKMEESKNKRKKK